MRANDPRSGYPESDIVTVTSGDGNTPQTAIDIPSDALYRPTAVKIEYDSAATTAVDVSLFDEPDGTTAGNVSDRRDRHRNIQPGESRMVDELDMRDVEQDVLVQTDGNQDDELDVTVYGELIVALTDALGGN